MSANILPVRAVTSPLEPELHERLLEAARLATVGRLVASFVHQMSTPLAAITLRAESLEQGAIEPGRALAPEKVQRYLGAIGADLDRCRRLLAALREFGGPLDERVELVDLAGLCRSAALLARDEATRRGVQVAANLEQSLAAVSGVKGRLGQAVLALLLNAIEASPSGGQVRLDAATAGLDAVAVSVADEGGGLSSDDRRRLFEPFASSRPATGGLGLGLMAARAVAEAHGGTIEALSEGRGCRVVLRLPRAGAREGVPQADATR